MLSRPARIIWICLALFTPAFGADAAGTPTTAEQLDFFETKIRPILVARCTGCHGPQKQEAGLRVDLRASLLKGGDTGPAIREDALPQSLLLEAINYGGNIQMPPQGKLPDTEIELLTTWVRNGCAMPQPDESSAPALGYAATPEGLQQARATHWAYQPIQRPTVPTPRDTAWSQNPLDQFILSTLESQGLTPNPPADRRTLLRRMAFDLLGLPPTHAEVAAFENDHSPDAVARTLERLLASSHYGERWGRHWLDIARYADTKGYVFTEERKYPFSYTYRDYVISALNSDVPFDRFVMEQLAADQLGGETSSLAAMGFLTLGRRFGNNQNDIIDDRIDVVTRGLLGLTVGCARCHDHKFDAIPTDDYYSLYGVFASSVEPGELPQIGAPTDIAAYQSFEEELGRRQAAVDQFVAESTAVLQDDLRSKSADYLLAATQQESPTGVEVKQQIVNRWRDYLQTNANATHPIFGPWRALMDLPNEGFPEAAGTLILALNDAADAQPRINTYVKQSLQSATISSKNDVARTYGELFAGVQTEWAGVRSSGATSLTDADREQLRQVLYAENSPLAIKDDELRKLLPRDQRNRLTELKRAVEAHQATSPGAPPRAMIMRDADQPVQPHIFVRGNQGRPGKEVPRQFLQVLQSAPQPFQRGSGRLELAQAIVSPGNPLTARVIVNRIWQQHFGNGLVRTPSDFGVRGELPTHPELLDWLASQLIEHGWSLKWLHRTIIESAVYQQTSDDRPEALQLDPENRLLWKMNRRRLEFEPLRDSLFAVAGQLDDRLGGRPVDLFAEPFVGRRAVYGFIDRQDLPGTLRVFDFASPDVSTARRAETTVPQQLLYQMNAPLVIQLARQLAAAASNEDRTAAIQSLHQHTYARSADPDELAAAALFLSDATADTETPVAGQLAPLEQLAQALLLANEFVFVD